jgi:hypothetical protein
MKKIILMLFGMMICCASCDDPVLPIESDIDSGISHDAESSWTAVKAFYISGGNSIDLSNYFKDFKFRNSLL